MSFAVLDACVFAAEKHERQRRKNAARSPYIVHPLRVARILAAATADDETVLVAALLHDTLEDTETTPEEIERRFGGRVAATVQQCSDDKLLSKAARKLAQIEHAAHASAEAALVKLADKIDNLGGMLADPPEGWTDERCQGYFAWSERVCEVLRSKFGNNDAVAILGAQLDDIFTQFWSANNRDSHNKKAVFDNYIEEMKKLSD